MNITATNPNYTGLRRALVALAAVSLLVAVVGATATAAYNIGFKSGALQDERLGEAYKRCRETGGRWQEGPELFQCIPQEVAQ